MVFSSLLFLTVFLPLNLVLYFISKNQTHRNWILIILSLLFYAWGEPVWISILLFSTFFDFLNGLIIEKYRGRWQSKAVLIASITVNLSLLGFFKYSGFVVQNLEAFLNIPISWHEYSLPIGISFYTFQTISYVIDVYRGEVSAQRSPFKLLLYVSLFHQLVAGPIVRYKDIAEQIENRNILPSGFSEGINRFVIGLAKKVILANTAGEIANLFLQGNLAEVSVCGAWFGTLMFALQIYFDFSGYSDMAIGLGKMFGFNYKENFNYPYIATSATEFWRRWHISLSSFFRDYVYIPLGGNRRLPFRNLLIVWFLTGLWHGASWNFILWGLYFGMLIILEKTFILRILGSLPRLLSHLYLIGAVLIGWVLFYYTDLSQAFIVLQIMFGLSSNSFMDLNVQLQISSNVYFIALALIATTPAFPSLAQKFPRTNGRFMLVFQEGLQPVINATIMITVVILLVGQSYNPFLYFRF